MKRRQAQRWFRERLTVVERRAINGEPYRVMHGSLTFEGVRAAREIASLAGADCLVLERSGDDEFLVEARFPARVFGGRVPKPAAVVA